MEYEKDGDRGSSLGQRRSQRKLPWYVVAAFGIPVVIVVVIAWAIKA
jgi:hypothetical protein